MVSKHLTKFGSHRTCCSRDTRELIFHVTLEDHLIKGFHDLMEESSSLSIPTLPRLIAIGIVVVAYMKILVSHVISQDHAII